MRDTHRDVVVVVVLPWYLSTSGLEFVRVVGDNVMYVKKKRRECGIEKKRRTGALLLRGVIVVVGMCRSRDSNHIRPNFTTKRHRGDQLPVVRCSD